MAQKFKSGDLVVMKGDGHKDVMIVVGAFQARKDQGMYYRVLHNGRIEFRHGANLVLAERYFSK